MSLRLFDTRVHELVDFVPLRPGVVTIYSCGPTVQSSPHVGHLRSALVYDLLARWLEYTGHAVTLVRNVTDIEDKVLVNAEAAGEDWRQLAQRSEREFADVFDALGVRRPTFEPRATGHITQMVELIERLLERGHAYVADGESGDVYFDTASWPDYGALTKQSGDDVEADPDQQPGKRSPRDFALWKGRKADEPESASWPAPWGRGRPGWHIECSAMAAYYLGTPFDIHGGGLDLRFPHHENELAQSRAAGDEFARVWMHNGLVSIQGQKMSKSLGNSVFAAELLTQARPIVVRYMLGAAHYRSTLELHADALAEAASAFERIEGTLTRIERLSDAPLTGSSVPAEFYEAMDEDLGVPAALAVVHDTVRAANIACDANDPMTASQLGGQLVAMLTVLGLNPKDSVWAEGSESATAAALDVLVRLALAERESARLAKDFNRSDRIRDDLTAAGIVIDDTPAGPEWSLNGG